MEIFIILNKCNTRQQREEGYLLLVVTTHWANYAIFFSAPPSGRVWHKAFFKEGSRRRAVDQIRPAVPKMPWSRRHLRCQVINLAFGRRVRVWGLTPCGSRRVSSVRRMQSFPGTHIRQPRPCNHHRQRQSANYAINHAPHQTGEYGTRPILRWVQA